MKSLWSAATPVAAVGLALSLSFSASAATTANDATCDIAVLPA